MKLFSIKKVNLPVAVVAVLSVAACTNIKKAAKDYQENVKAEATPKVLELHGDSVAYEVSFTVPAKKFHKKASVKIEPVLQYSNDSDSRPPVTIKGDAAPGKGKLVIDSKTGGTVTFEDKFAYSDKMSKSKLVAKETFMITGEEKELNQCIEIPGERLLADGIITTSRMLKSDEDVLLSVDEYVPVDKTQSITVYYLINNATFNPKFKDKNSGVDNGVQIASLSTLLQDPTFEITGLNFNSFASPDGEMDRNEELSSDRSEATVVWFKQYLKKLGRFEMFDSNFKAANHFKEDWKGWKSLVQASDLSDKDAILAIMNNNSLTDDDKEAQIKSKHAASYEKMKNVLLPKLRRTEITFTAKGGLKTDEDLKAQANSLDNLNQDEVMQLGKIVNNVNDRKRIYGYYVSKYNNDWRGYNNLAVANLQAGEVEDGMKNLKKADELSRNNAYVLNNMGVAYKMQKQYTESEEKYRAAKSKMDRNVNPDYNLGVLYTRMGKYTNASESFKNTTCRYNVALAYLLKGEYDNAEKTFNCIPAEKKDADTYYLMAVTSARKGKLDGVSTNLARAIQMDSKLKSKAKDDLEFRDFKGKSEFENLLR
jgi:tetratricopeptide (TPR) repeat protein